MRYLYTTEPDEGCHEFEPGIYGRPVQTCDEKRLKAKGWRATIDGIRQEQGQEENRQGREEVDSPDQVLEEARDLYKQMFGKRPHHKMKAETILQKVEEANDQG